MVVSKLKSKWIAQSYRKCFYSVLHMSLERRDTKFYMHPNVSTLKGRTNKDRQKDGHCPNIDLCFVCHDG